MDMRESFEAHFRKIMPGANFHRLPNGEYHSMGLQVSWTDWQAATAAADERAVGIVREEVNKPPIFALDAIVIAKRIEKRIKGLT